jgi:hypothetical protein
MRLGSKGVARRGLIALLLCSGFAGSIAACGGRGTLRDVRLQIVVQPANPTVGSEASVRVTLRDDHSRPLRGARLQVEAHMAHPGMAPLVAEAHETADGTYVARIPFSMAGEWTLVATGVLNDGSRIDPHVERTNVRPAP